MRKRKTDRVGAPALDPPNVLGCFDADMQIARHGFADAVPVCDVVVAGPPVAAGRPDELRFGEQAIDLSGLLDWLAPLAEGGGWAFYLHHHDNIVVEVARLAPYTRAAFRRALWLFRTRPAAEGGANLLGVVGPRRAWLLVAENDNQGGLRVDFFGPVEVCRDLRARLSQQRLAVSGTSPDG